MFKPAELNQRAATMVLHREKCVLMANNDIARFTRDMAKLLDMTVTVCNEKVPVQNRDDWCHSLIEDPSNEQTQKFIFALPDDCIGEIVGGNGIITKAIHPGLVLFLHSDSCDSTQ
jgi:hypothetical protein